MVIFEENRRVSCENIQEILLKVSGNKISSDVNGVSNNN